MSIESITAQIKAQSKKIPPVELWDPQYCGEIAIHINERGEWFYQNTLFKRPALVKLLASVLKKEADDYFLVTPIEKLKISVEDVPFILTEWHWQDTQQSIMQVNTNVGDEFVLDASHPLTSNDKGELYVLVRRNLYAKVHRNIYYQWVNLGQEFETKKGTEMVFFSAKQQFSLGEIS